MQTATARVIDTQITEVKKTNQVRYALSLFEADLSGRQTGHRFLPEKGIVQVTDIQVAYPNQSEAAFSGRPGVEEYVYKTKTSMAIMKELADTYSMNGFLYLSMLDNQPDAFVAKLEEILLPTKTVEEFGRKTQRPYTLLELTDYLASLKPTLPSEFKALIPIAAQAHDAIYEHIKRVIPALRQELTAYQAEYASRKRGDAGIAYYTEPMKLRAREVGVTLVEDASETIAPTTTPAPSVGGIDVEMLSTLITQSTAAAVKAVMTEFKK